MKTRICTLISALVIMSAACAVAQKVNPPEGGKPMDFTLPKSHLVRLNNGLEATLIPYGDLPKVTISLIVRAGNVNENERQVWLADLTGDLMKEGTTSRTGQEIAEEAASMGGSINVSVGPDQTVISGDVLSDNAPRLVALIADLVRNPKFPESELPRLKNDRLRELSVDLSQPGNLAQKRFRELLYPGHPYGRLYPTEEMLKGYTIDDVKGFYAANFGAVRSHLYVAGVFDQQATEAAVRSSFDGWKKGPDLRARIPQPISHRAIHLVDRPGASQSNIYMGLPVINPADKEYIRLLVANVLLGGSFGSRITTNIRENKGYTYSPYSTVSVRYRDGYWQQVADVTTSVTGAALKEIFYEIDRLRNEPPTRDELKGIQNYMAGIFVLNNSSRRGVINQLSFIDLHGLKQGYLTSYVRNVYAVTPKDVQRIVAKYIDPDKMTIVITGDKKVIADQVGQFGKIEE